MHPPRDPQPASGLQHSLKQRHMTMIALGGVIGAGLFVGSCGRHPVGRARPPSSRS